MKLLSEQPITWRALAIVVLVCVAPVWASGTRPSSKWSSGGGILPVPPSSPAGPVGNLATPPGEHLRLPLVVAISGSEPAYLVVVTAPGGAVVGLGSTDTDGLLSLNVPAMPGLELDVVGTSVIGLPVHGGQIVAITLP